MRVTLTSHKVRLWRLAWVVISLMASVSFPEGVGAVEIRAWQFHAPDWGYVRRVLAKTAEYDINTVVFSHEIVGFVSELYDGSDRADSLRAVAEDARSRGLRVWIWLHELEHDVPSAFLNDGVVDFDNPALWTWLDEKYERLFNDFPAFDGIQLTFSQTPYPLFDNLKVRSPLSVADRFARLINALATVCDRHEKDLVVRSFLGEPEQLEWFRQAIGQAPPDVMVQSKCVPFDWQPFFPHNPLLGAFPERRQVVEFDCSSEYTGKNRIPYTSPEYFQRRWRYAEKQPGVIGYNARLDHGGYDALFTPNEINLYSLKRLTADPDVTADDIWSAWAVDRYAGAAVDVVAALKPTFEAVNLAFFPVGFWVSDHSTLPSLAYAGESIPLRSTAKWRPDEPEWVELEEMLTAPDTTFIERLLAEKDRSISLSDESLDHLAQARLKLPSDDYEDLRTRLERLRRAAVVWRLHTEGLFVLRALKAGSEVAGAEERVRRAIEGLRIQAEFSREAAESEPPLPMERLEAAARELERLLEEAKK